MLTKQMEFMEQWEKKYMNFFKKFYEYEDIRNSNNNNSNKNSTTPGIVISQDYVIPISKSEISSEAYIKIMKKRVEFFLKSFDFLLQQKSFRLSITFNNLDNVYVQTNNLKTYEDSEFIYLEALVKNWAAPDTALDDAVIKALAIVSRTFPYDQNARGIPYDMVKKTDFAGRMMICFVIRKDPNTPIGIKILSEEAEKELLRVKEKQQKEQENINPDLFVEY